MSTRKLTAIKKYLIENLKKGFIKLLSFFFLSPILFIKKKNRDLRFYINYRNLNQLIKKKFFISYFRDPGAAIKRDYFYQI